MQAAPNEREALLLRRAVLAEASPVLTLDLPAALRAAFATAAQRHSEAKLIEVSSALSVLPATPMTLCRSIVCPGSCLVSQSPALSAAPVRPS